MGFTGEIALTQDDIHGTTFMSEADEEYLRDWLPDNIFGELVAFLTALPDDLRPLFVKLVCQDAEELGENALIFAMARLHDATHPPESSP